MTSEKVLAQIKAIAARKQQHGSDFISLDTLMLILRMRESELMPRILELQENGEVIYHPATTTHTRRSRRPGNIILSSVAQQNASGRASAFA
jgi:hypothetical protein